MPTIQDIVDSASVELSQQFTKAVSDWLGKCVERFCKEAYEHFKRGDHMACAETMRCEGYRFDQENDGMATRIRFLCGDVTLACAKIEIELFKRH